MAKFILFLYSFFETRRKQLFIGTALFMVVSLFFAVQIGLNEDIAKATSNSSEKQQKALKSLNIENKMFVIISNENGDDNSFKQMSGAATKIAEELKKLQPDTIKDILYTVDQQTMKKVFDFVALHPYLYLDEDDYKAVTKETTTVAIKNRLEQKYRQLLTPAGFAIKESLFRDPLDITPLAMQKFSHLQKSGNIHLKNGFFLSDDDRHLIMFITLNGSSNETSKNADMLAFVRKTIDQVRQKEIAVSLFGPVVIADENAKIAKKDITLSLSITLTLLMLLTALFFRKTYSILIILLPALSGGISAIAIFSIAGHPLSAIALGIGSMMLGITVDYAIHLYTHYLSSHSITEALKEVVKPIITGALTTILAFLSLFSVSLHVLHDLALFSALSVAISAIFTLVVMPHILAILPPSKKVVALPKPSHRLTTFHIPISIKITIVILLTAFLGFFSSKTGFDDDLNQMKYTSPALEHSEQLFNSIVGNSDDSIYFASAGESPERALLKSYKTVALLEKFKKKKMITSFVSPAQFVLPREIQIEKIEQWNNFWTQNKKMMVVADLASSARLLHFKKGAFSPFSSLLHSVPQTLLAADFSPISSTLFREQIKILPSSSLIIT
ncbi:MMPL family transporter, partial [bacterium]|nr:MMPL family transporter [bacterium]